MSRHRSPRPRYGRIALALMAAAVTVFSVLAGIGLVTISPSAAGESLPGVGARLTTPEPRSVDDSAPPGPQGPAAPATSTAVPTDSGTGRRVVFSQSSQRVWLVRANDTVRRTYLVSGSVTDNLDPGTYRVYSRSRWAVGIDDSGVMQHFVRFARGDNAAIGFHSIPTKDGRALQSRQQLGTPQSHGCIRQAKADAMAMWRFAAVGSTVVVV